MYGKLCVMQTDFGRGALIALVSALAIVFSIAPAQAAPPVAGAQALRLAKMADLGQERASAEVQHVADWAVHSADHGGLPFLVDRPT